MYLLLEWALIKSPNIGRSMNDYRYYIDNITRMCNCENTICNLILYRYQVKNLVQILKGSMDTWNLQLIHSYLAELSLLYSKPTNSWCGYILICLVNYRLNNLFEYDNCAHMIIVSLTNLSTWIQILHLLRSIFELAWVSLKLIYTWLLIDYWYTWLLIDYW